MWNLIGHDSVFAALQSDIETGNLAHANLFIGPDHIGKYSAAKWLTRYLQCTEGGCGECHICNEIERGLHADTIELTDNGETIKIEQVRSLIDKINMTRRERYKILLISNIERMTAESSNALLKTLEDPPDGVLFLLTTSHEKEVLSTIISRVRLYKFANLTEEEILGLIKARYPQAQDEAVRVAADLSGGKPGKALQLMENSELFESYRTMYEDVKGLIAEPDKVRQSIYAADLVSTAKDSKNSQLIADFLDVFQLILRKNMIMNVNGESGILPQAKVLEMLAKIDSIREYSKRNVNTRMMLENLMFTL